MVTVDHEVLVLDLQRGRMAVLSYRVDLLVERYKKCPHQHASPLAKRSSIRCIPTPKHKYLVFIPGMCERSPQSISRRSNKKVAAHDLSGVCEHDMLGVSA